MAVRRRATCSSIQLVRAPEFLNGHGALGRTGWAVPLVGAMAVVGGGGHACSCVCHHSYTKWARTTADTTAAWEHHTDTNVWE